MDHPPLTPGLYIVATPIGNLGDLTARAADVLSRADLVLAEDKRVSAKLLHHVGARTPMRAYNDHSNSAQREDILAMLATKAVALVSDAGTPLISDPGFKLVRAARAAGMAVHTLPGPSAVIAALTLAGLPTDRFLFLGFLPPKSKARREAIGEVAGVRATLVLYESGPRLGDCLGDLFALLGAREAAVVREISKLHEESVIARLDQLAERYAEMAPKGEIVVVVGPPPDRGEVDSTTLDEALKTALASLSASRAAATVAAELGIPRKRAYARALELSR